MIEQDDGFSVYQFPEFIGFPIWFIDEAHVNIDDLVSATPGRIVRCMGNPNDCVKIYSDNEPHLFDYCAGAVSENA